MIINCKKVVPLSECEFIYDGNLYSYDEVKNNFSPFTFKPIHDCLKEGLYLMVTHHTIDFEKEKQIATFYLSFPFKKGITKKNAIDTLLQVGFTKEEIER